MHEYVVNFVMHCLNYDINFCDALLFASKPVSFLILKKIKMCNFRRLQSADGSYWAIASVG
jgi:hypothetical protein